MEQAFGLDNVDNLHGVKNSAGQATTLHHLTLVDLRKLNLVEPDMLDSYFKFTIIRDPFDRMASDYLWQQQHDAHNIFRSMSFNQYLTFAEQVIEEGLYFQKIHFDHFRPMIMYCIHDGKFLLDDILIFEKINQELDRVSHRIGSIQLKKVNSSKNYDHLRSTANRDRVYRLYEPDKVLYDNIVKLDNPQETNLY